MSDTPLEILVGMNDGSFFRRGWHERERDGRTDIPVRAMGDEAEIFWPARPERGGLMRLLISAPVSLIGEPATGSITFGDTRMPLRIEFEGWFVRTVMVPADGMVGHVRLTCDNPVVPDQVLRNGDGRRIGWRVSALWIEVPRGTD
jgi:hypothetical protein